MFCQQCGKRNSDHSQFCGACGFALQKIDEHRSSGFSELDLAEAKLNLEVLKEQGYIRSYFSDDEPFARTFFTWLLRWRETKAKRRLGEERQKEADREWIESLLPSLLRSRRIQINLALGQNSMREARRLKRIFRDYFEAKYPKYSETLKIYVSEKRRIILVTI